MHRWHTAVAAAARRRAGRGAWVLLVPAARSPLKLRGQGPSAPDADRIEMLRRATRRSVRTAIWTDELRRGGTSYTIVTLRRLRRLVRPGVRIWMLIGADQAVNFHRWRKHREILRLLGDGGGGVLVALRPPHASVISLVRALRATGAWSDAELAEWADRVVRCGVRPISSTRVRAAAALGDGALLRRLVSPAVAAWIQRRGLYRDGR